MVAPWSREHAHLIEKVPGRLGAIIHADGRRLPLVGTTIDHGCILVSGGAYFATDLHLVLTLIALVKIDGVTGGHHHRIDLGLAII